MRLKQFADVFSKEQAIPSCIALTIPEIKFKKQDGLTKAILEYGMFSAREYVSFNMLLIRYYLSMISTKRIAARHSVKLGK